MTLEEKRKVRYLTLKAIYDATDGVTTKDVLRDDLVKWVGLEEPSVDNAIAYLSSEGLVVRETRAHICITHAGVVQIENADSHPGQATTYFPPVNIITNNLSLHGSNNTVQQGTVDSHQTAHLSLPVITDIKTLLAELKAKLPSAGLTPEAVKEVESDITSIEGQLNGPKPKKGVVQSLLKNIGDVVKGASSKVFTDWLTKAISGLQF